MSEDTTVAATEGGLPLIQRRVARFCLAFGALNLTVSALRAITSAAELTPIEIPPETLIAQATSGVSLVLVFVFLSPRRRSRRQVRLAEGAALLVTGIAYALIAFFMTLDVVEAAPVRHLAEHDESAIFALFAIVLPAVGGAFTLTYVMIVRAAIVPTRASYTALLTLTVGIPLVLVTFTVGTAASYLRVPVMSPYSFGAGGAMLWLFTTVICASISHVIYGLREEVREAQRLGQYTLEGLIGEGGMGMVYRASHLMLRRPTAIKLLPPDRAGEEALGRFEREVRLTAQLTHPNTVTIYDYGRTADGVFYYAMELLDGATLEEVVEVDGPQPVARVVRILDQVAGALGEAHAIGLIHRDIKPANIVLSRQGGELDVAKVVDFGLVKELHGRGSPLVSRAGTISGTPLYMAPEILRDPGTAGPASDLYALGAVGYYLLTGEHVFGGGSVIEVLGHHLHSAVESPSSRLGEAIDPALEALVLACLAKDPADRPADADELRRVLEAVAVERWSQRSARRWWEVYEPSVRARRTKTPAGSGTRTTMAIDVDSREKAVSAADVA